MKNIGMWLLAAGFAAVLSAGCVQHEIVYVEKNANGAKTAVTPEKAVEIAVRHAGFESVDDVNVKKCEPDLEETGLVFEVEFTKLWHEYEYDIDANTGRVVKMKKKLGW